MQDKQLKDKAIDIKGKKYVVVADRIVFFNDEYPYGSIVTELLSAPDAETVVIKATASPDQKRFFTGHSQATWDDGYINKTSALENAETSAVGRALAMMGIGVIESIASVDEINKDETRGKAQAAQKQATLESRLTGQERITFSQVKAFWDAAKKTGKTPEQVKSFLAELNNYIQVEAIQKDDFESAFKWASSPLPVAQDLLPALNESLSMANAKKATVGQEKPDPAWKTFWQLAKRHGVPEADVHKYATEHFGMKQSLTELTPLEVGKIAEWIATVQP